MVGREGGPAEEGVGQRHTPGPWVEKADGLCKPGMEQMEGSPQEGEHRQRLWRRRLPGLILTASAKASGLASLPHPWTPPCHGKKKRELLPDEPLLCADTASLVQNFHSPLQALIEGSTKFAVCFPSCAVGMTRVLSPRAVRRLEVESPQRGSADPAHTGCSPQP